MIFRTGAAANKINGRLQEVGFLNKHIVSKIIHTPIVYSAGNWAGPPRSAHPRPPPPVKADAFLNRCEKIKPCRSASRFSFTLGESRYEHVCGNKSCDALLAGVRLKPSANGSVRTDLS